MAQPVASKDARILIVGAGVFGLSTALHLARDGYTNITLLDRASVPSPYSAGNDINKIVRAEYEDPFYAEKALEAIKQWQTPFWSAYYRPTGYLITTSANAPEKSRISLQKSFSSIQNHPAFPPGSFSAIDGLEDIQEHAPMLQGDMNGWTGYLNRHAGYARAAKALEHAAKWCEELGVRLITGEYGHVVELLFAQDNKTCTGVKTARGPTYMASRTILCLGAHIGKLLPNITQQVTAKAWSVAHIQLTPTEAAEMRGCPVVMCRDLGFFFEPDEDTGLLKFSANGAGYTNYEHSPTTGEEISIPTRHNEGLPRDDEDLIRRLIDEAIPQFSGRALINKCICWCGDTAESDYIIDYVPGTKGLIVAAGDSGHAFKMLPVAGQWVVKTLQDGKQLIPRWKWRHGEQNSEDISWRVGTLKDIKDVQISGLRSRL